MRESIEQWQSNGSWHTCEWVMSRMIWLTHPTRRVTPSGVLRDYVGCSSPKDRNQDTSNRRQDKRIHTCGMTPSCVWHDTFVSLSSRGCQMSHATYEDDSCHAWLTHHISNRRQNKPTSDPSTTSAINRCSFPPEWSNDPRNTVVSCNKID